MISKIAEGILVSKGKNIMNTIQEVEKFIKAQPDYNGGRYAIHGTSNGSWSLSYHRVGQTKSVVYSFKVNDNGVTFDYQRL